MAFLCGRQTDLSQIFSGDAPLLAGTKLKGLVDDTLTVSVETVAMAIRADHDIAHYNGITTFTDFIGDGVVCDLFRLLKAFFLGRVRHRVKF